VIRIDSVYQAELPDGVIENHAKQKRGALINDVKNGCENLSFGCSSLLGLEAASPVKASGGSVVPSLYSGQAPPVRLCDWPAVQRR
jgi:hypothetical protein